MTIGLTADPPVAGEHEIKLAAGASILACGASRRKRASQPRSVNTPISFSHTPGAPSTGTQSKCSGTIMIGSW